LATETTMPSSTASVSGKLIVNTEPCARLGGDRDPAAKLLDRPLDHVHADATTGDVRQFFCCRESGMENQVVDFLVAHVGVWGDQAVLDRLVANPLAVDTGAVVGDFDNDAARTMLRAQTQDTLGILADRGTFFRRFEPMVHGVADHVGQWFGELVDNCLVDFGVFTFRDKAHVLAGHVGNFADDTAHALEHRLDRLGADRHDAVLDFPGQLLQFLEAEID
jgi:hypothetical protein